MVANSTLTPDEHFSLPAGKKIVELLGPMVDVIFGLEQRRINACKTKIIECFRMHSALLKKEYSNMSFAKHTGCHVIIIFA